MRCVGRRGGGEVEEILGGGIKRGRRQFQGRKGHIRVCVRIIIWTIRE